MESSKLDNIEKMIEMRESSTNESAIEASQDLLDVGLALARTEMAVLAEALPLNSDSSKAVSTPGLESILKDLVLLIVYSYDRGKALSVGEHYFLRRFFDDEKLYEQFIEFYNTESKYRFNKYRCHEGKVDFYEQLPESLIKLFDEFGARFITANGKKATDEDRMRHLLQIDSLYRMNSTRKDKASNNKRGTHSVGKEKGRSKRIILFIVLVLLAWLAFRVVSNIQSDVDTVDYSLGTPNNEYEGDGISIMSPEQETMPNDNGETEYGEYDMADRETNTSSDEYIPYHDYVVQADLKVREGPGKQYKQLKREQLDLYYNSSCEGEFAALEKGSIVTCVEVQGDWMNIYEGWICIKEDGEYFVR